MNITEYPLVDKATGRRYRMIGNCKEYAPDFVFTHAKPNTNKKSITIVEQASKATAKKNCPFKSGIATNCTGDCALYGKAACVLAMQGEVPARDTRGARCPIYKKTCGEDCALYGGGCGLRKLVNGLYAGKEK